MLLFLNGPVVAQTKAVTDMLISQGSDPIGSNPAEFRDRIQSDISKWTATIKAAGLKPE